MSGDLPQTSLSGPVHERRIGVLRHGQALHNVQRPYPERDPPLTDIGVQEAANVHVPFTPDVIICSPLLRAIQTAFAVNTTLPVPLKLDHFEIWPTLRELWDAECNKGSSRSTIQAAYPLLDLSRCMEEWDYEAHSDESAALRAQRIIAELQQRPERNILVVSHRGIIECFTEGTVFANCELRIYKLGAEGRLEPED